jgi:hypothetical protein
MEVNRVRLVTLASIGFVSMCLALPVTAAAYDGRRHDQCQAAAGSEYYGGSGEECPAPGVTAQPAPAPSPRLPAPQSSAGAAVAVPAPPAPPAPALPTPGPATTPGLSPGVADLRPSLLGVAAIAGLAVLLLSGFHARRRLQRGWD